MSIIAEDAHIASETPRSSIAPWLLYLEQELAPEASDDFTGVESEILNIIRDMLLTTAPGNVKSAADNAVQQIQMCYSANYLKEESPDRNQPDHGAEGVLHSVCTFVFDLASQIPYNDPKHKALALLLAGLRTTASSEFDAQNPQLIYTNDPLLMVAGEGWNHSQVNKHDGQRGDLKKKCNESINVSAFIARLLNEGMLGDYGLHWAGRDLMDGLENANFDSNDQVHVCWAVVAISYMLFAGRLIAQEVKNPTSELKEPLTRARWTAWSSRLEDIARATPDEAEWSLRLKAKKALEEMATLYAEFLQE